MSHDVWILAARYDQAAAYARDHLLGVTGWFYVDKERVRGRMFSPHTTLVYLPGFDERRDADEIESQLGMIEAISPRRPTVTDLRHPISDELLQSRGALEEWLAS